MGMSLPAARGPLTEPLLAALSDPERASALVPPELSESADALGDDDLQLALFLLHELHYGGLAGVGDELEWNPGLVGFRSALEDAMLERLIEETGGPAEVVAGDVGKTIFELVAVDDAPPISRFLEARATAEQFREFVIHRSAYQLKEADPHTFGIPRVGWPAKSAMVEIQADEYGNGDPERMHSRLFAKTMEELGLDPSYGTYVERLPGTTLATVNLITLFALRRRWRGALVGHLACFEITSPTPNRRYANGLRRLGAGPRATEFFDEHVEADSVHENIAAYDLAGGLAAQEPELAGDILFGVRSLLLVEARWAGALLGAWEAEESSLLPTAVTLAA